MWGAAAAAMHYAIGVSTALALSPALLSLHLFVFKLFQLVPRNLQAVGLAPTITGGAAMIAVMGGLGSLFAGSWRSGVECYMDLAGSLILSLVAPAVIALAFKVHNNRREIARLWLPLLLTSALTVPTALLAAAAAAAPLQLAPSLALAMAPRHISSAMAGNDVSFSFSFGSAANGRIGLCQNVRIGFLLFAFESAHILLF